MIAYWRFIAAAIFAVILAISHVWTYHMGKQSGKAMFDKALLEQTEQIAKLEAQARQRERELTDKSRKVEKDYEARKTEMVVTRNNTERELNKLRDTIAANSKQSRASENPPTCPRVDDRPAELFRACAENLTGVAAEADAVANALRGLQAYVLQVCLEQ